MSTYESDHNLRRSSSVSSQDDRRQYYTLSTAIDTFLTNTVDVNRERLSGREIFENALRLMNEEEGSRVIQNFLEALERMGSNFGPKSEGVDDEFLDSLERVDLESLPDDADCPICTNKFCDNTYPLIVKLPCSPRHSCKAGHIFDMDCIAPWLKINSTCPLCRFNVQDAAKIRKERLEEELRLAREADDDDDDDEEGDRDLYG